MTYAGIGIYSTPKIEQALGMVPTKQEQEELDRATGLRVIVDEGGAGGSGSGSGRQDGGN